MASAALMQPGDPSLPLTLAELQRNYREHEHGARAEFATRAPGHVERAQVHATLAAAAAQMAQVLALVGGEATG